MATTGATLDSIYERLHNAPEYHPFNADTFSDWSMEAGDMIRISRDGKDYDSPVHNSTLNWKGQSQISVSSEGNEKRESIAKATKKKYGRGGSGYRNDNHLWQELLDDYNGLYSFFEVTSSRMYTHFEGLYDGLSSTFEVTRSRMYTHFEGLYDGLSSTLEVTRSRMYVHFDGMYDGLSSTFQVTRSQLYASLSDATTELQSNIDAQAGRISLVVEGTGSNAHIKPASIVAAINNGESTIKLSANHIQLDGAAVATSLQGQQIGALAIDADRALLWDLTTVNLYIQDYQVKIYDASVSGNILTINKTDGTSLTFSKATSLRAEWDGNRTFTVSASPQEVSRYTTIFSAVPKADISWSGTTGTATLRASLDGGESSTIAGTVTVNGDAVYNSVTVPAANIYEYQNAYYNSTTHNTTVYIEAKASNENTGRQTFHVSGAEAYAAGRLAGWNAACDKIFRSGNTIYCPKKNNLDGAATAKYVASYKASSYTKESYTASSNSYSPGVYVPSSYTASSYSASSYTKESHSYTASSHSYTAPTMKLGISTYYSSFNMDLKNFTGKAVFSKGSDSYTASKHSYTASRYTASSYTKERYTTSSYKASSNSYTPSRYTASSYSASSLTWTDY